MSSVIFPQISKIAGNAVGGPLGEVIGLGANLLHDSLAKPKTQHSMGPRLTEITMQTATYGKMIPIVYGTVKLAGNIIWAGKVKEHRQDHYQRRGKFSSRALVASQFHYTISVAIAICEGEINQILRVWANDKLVDLSCNNYRIYNGTEGQMPDPLIEATCGHNRTPAFRGLAYVVIEDLPITEYGGRMPNFLFEVKRKVKTYSQHHEVPLEERIKSMVMIPGSGEFVYDTVVQAKVSSKYDPRFGNFNAKKTKINQNNRDGKADSLVALQQLADTCPNLEWVAPVVGWFATSLEARNCNILPGVEYQSTDTIPDKWNVAGFDRNSAHLISQTKYSTPLYGGTTNDLAIVRYLDLIKSYNYKILFYPMVFVDEHNKPWRGRISGVPEDVHNFFYGPNGYNKFILHYARLVKGKVDSFIIGSEMVGLTKIRDKDNKFPAVQALIDLARQVKEIMGPGVKITYAADWSEYHHTDYGWYNLDPLWASDYIDYVGIDAYFPLTNATENFYDEERIIEGWHSGEGYDFYYADQHKTDKQPLGPDYAWKNIRYWWENEHINPDGSKTPWQPKQKKIWFTEIGFPSVDLASNQPNVFYSPDSIESNFPIHSKGRVDFVAQRQALEASEKYWRNSEFLERMFIWTWDARPYPFWPDLTKIWGDGGCWSRGHWVNGKLGLTTLQAIVQELCLRSGLALEKIRAEQLTDLVDGLVISSTQSAKDIINLLKSAYFFDSNETDDQLFFVKKINSNATTIDSKELVLDDGQAQYAFTITKLCQSNLFGSIGVHYFNYLFDYHLSVEFHNNYCYPTKQTYSLHLPIIIDPEKAKTIAEVTLEEKWQGQFIYQFALPPEYLTLKPNDVIFLKKKQDLLPMRITCSSVEAGRINKITAISTKQNIYQQQAAVFASNRSVLLDRDNFDPGYSELVALKLPELPYEVHKYTIHLGIIGNDEHWRGAEVLCPDNNMLLFYSEAITGLIETITEESIELTLFSGELSSKTEQELNRYANLAAIGNEVIQFQEAEYLGNNRYCLKNVKRNMFNSKTHENNRFVLIDHNLQKFVLSKDEYNKKQEFFVTSVGHNLEQAVRFEV